MRTIALTISILIVSLGCNGFVRTAESGLVKEIQQRADRIVENNDLPGLNLSLVFKDREPINYASGFADYESRSPMTPEHVMFSGSIGKTYAVAILMQLVDEGKIRLHDKYIDYFPDNKWLHRLPNIGEITIEMLLQHTSGLPRYVLKPELWEKVATNPDKIWTYRDRMEYIFDDSAVHEAGLGWSYSDSNYILLGMLIEKITGSDYYDLLDATVLKNMALSKTFPAISRNIKNLPQGYSKLPEMFNMPEKVVENGKYIFNPQMEWTGGGMASTASDLARWAMVYYDEELFSDFLKEKVRTPNSMGKMIEPGLSYGMGSFIFETEHGNAYGHTGFVPGFNSIFAFFPDKEVAIAIQINCDYATAKTRLIDYAEDIISLIQ